jgi:Antirepressor regulating drug resistance, predicted signal transduction N-terminal membrane component
MVNILIQLFNMSITASYLIVAIILVRLLFKNLPRKFICLLWGLVAIRLIFPFTIESITSLIPKKSALSEDIIYKNITSINRNVTPFHNSINPLGNQLIDTNVKDSFNIMHIVLTSAVIVWIIGMAILVMYSLITFIRLRRMVSTSVPLKENIYLSDNIQAPFILGVLKPHIYVPFSLDELSLAYVIAHEKAHIKRLDHWIKPISFLILSVYWFNPLLWVAYILLCRDIELACDEKVIEQLGFSEKKAYSNTLLACSSKHLSISMCPLAFGEVGVKQRIKNILNYKKPTLWVIIMAFIVGITIILCFMFNPEGQTSIDVTSQNNHDKKITTTNIPTSSLQSTPIPSIQPTQAVPVEPTQAVNDDGFIINDANKKDITVASADINHDGIDEKISIDLSVYDIAQPAYIKIYNRNHKVIFKEMLFSANVAQNSFYLYTKKDKTYLLTYIPYCEQGGCSYKYDLFYLDKNNKKVNVASKNIFFDIYNVEDKKHYNIASLINFYNDINSYLNKSMLLISTIDGKLEYSTDKEKLSKTEEYSFLYSYGSVLVYDQDDSIKEKLEKYQEFVINMKKGKK